MPIVFISGDLLDNDEIQKILEDEFDAAYDEDTVAFIDVDSKEEGERIAERIRKRLDPDNDKGLEVEVDDEDDDFDDEDFDDEEYEDEEEDCEECEGDD